MTRQEQYREYLQSEDWQNKRAEKNRRVKVRRCAFCAASGRLDLHHLVYRNLVDVGMSDLRFACRPCHGDIHRLINAGRLRYRSTNPTYRYHETVRVLNMARKGILFIEKPSKGRCGLPVYEQ
jgi:hypothetical protein